MLLPEKNECFLETHANRIELSHLVAASLAGTPKPMVPLSGAAPYLFVLENAQKWTDIYGQ